MKSIMMSLTFVAAGIFSVFTYTKVNAQAEGHPNCNTISVIVACAFDPSYSCYTRIDANGNYAYCPQKRNYPQ